MTWLRYRFKSQEEDFRPLSWPPPGPWWCSGYGGGWDEDEENDSSYAQLIAYYPKGKPLTDDWPEAYDIEEPTEHAEITFSSRFPKPDWFNP